MSDTLKTLTEFIITERDRFENRDNNRFAVSFSKLTRYYEFLRIILERYGEAGRRFLENTKEAQALTKPGHQEVTRELAQVMAESWPLTTRLHLEIESFYLFAKILLDHVARNFELYFGQVRKRSLDSHDDLVRNVAAYATALALTLPDGFMDAAAVLKRDISDHRDYEIAHEKSPRTMHATTFSGKRTSIASTKLYPKETDKQVETEDLETLLERLDAYLLQVIDFIAINRDKACLKAEATPPGPSGEE